MMQPLSSTKRNIYLICFVFLFVLVIPLLILYSEGYRFGNSLSLVKTGGIYLYSDIADTTVYVDGTLEKQTGLFLRNTFIQNLKPDTYWVSVEKEDYRTWEKEFEVFENKVTDAKVFMIKEVLASTTVSKIIPTASSSIAIATTAKSILNPDYVEIEKLFAVATTSATSTNGLPISQLPQSKATSTNQTSSTTEVLIDERRLKPEFQERSDTYSWLENGDVVLNWVGSYERTPFYFCMQGQCVDEVFVSIDEDILEYYWLSGNVEAMVLRTENAIYVSEVDSRSRANVYKVYEGQSEAVRVSSTTGDIIVAVDDKFVIFELD